MKKEYKPRIADKLLARKLAGKGAVLIEGPKWCGKTTTAQQQAKSMLDLGDSEVLKQSRNMLEISPKTLLQGETPRLIDEWQTLPPLWDSIRSEVDRRGTLFRPIENEADEHFRIGRVFRPSQSPKTV